MEALTEGRVYADTSADVGDLLAEFLANMPGEALSLDAKSVEDCAEMVLCSVVRSGVRYTLSCHPCPLENETPSALSPREKEIVRLVMKGLSTRGIAQLLEISPWTVSTHLRRIFLKLGVSSRAEMVAQVMRDGVLAGWAAREAQAQGV
jgi:DNA-binding CsgD family transcriptional regulator